MVADLKTTDDYNRELLELQARNLRVAVEGVEVMCKAWIEPLPLAEPDVTAVALRQIQLLLAGVAATHVWIIFDANGQVSEVCTSQTHAANQTDWLNNKKGPGHHKEIHKLCRETE